MTQKIIEKTTFKGSPVFTIWETDENGNKKDFPLISFGKKKAQALVEFADEIKDFAEGGKDD